MTYSEDNIVAITVFATVANDGVLTSHFVPIPREKVRRFVSFLKHNAYGGKLRMTKQDFDLTKLQPIEPPVIK